MAMLTQTKAKTARRIDLNAVKRPALLKIRLKSDANFLTQRNDLNRRGHRASMHGFKVGVFIRFCRIVQKQVLYDSLNY